MNPFNEEPPEIKELIDEKQYPDFWQQIDNFKKFSQDVGQTVVGNQSVFVSQEESDIRMSTCMECPDFNHEQKRCYLCGCFMEHKVKFTASKCPASKW
jgi:hypothetical protein